LDRWLQLPQWLLGRVLQRSPALERGSGAATLYSGVPATVPGLLASGHTSAKEDGDLSIGATYHRLLANASYERETFKGERLDELKALMGVPE